MMNQSNTCDLEVKLQSVFLQLRTLSDSPIEDDTVLQKLQSYIHMLIQRKDNQLLWSNYIGLVTYIRDTLDDEYVKNEKNHSAITFALHCFSFLLEKEENFFFLSDHKSMINFHKSLPILRENMSYSAGALKVAKSMVGHSSGCNWVMESGLWEQLLIPCLKCQSVFVQRDCVKVISILLLKTEDSKKFASIICDLDLVLHKFREIRYKLNDLCKEGQIEDNEELNICIAKLKFNSETVLLVFYNLLLETLGKRSIYKEMKPTVDVTSKILFRLNFKLIPQTVVKLSEMLLLSTLHRFQDHILKFGTAEQFHLDSITCDILSLIRHMISKGHYAQFLLATYQVHRFWDIMCTNIKSKTNAELSKSESVVFMILRFQLVPLRVICDSSLEIGNEEDCKKLENTIDKWREDVFAKMSIRDEQKVEIRRLELVLREKFAQNLEDATQQVIVGLSYCSAVIDHFHPTCALTVFQALTFLLQFKLKVSTRIDYNARMYMHIIDLMKSIIKKFDIDWSKWYESSSIVSILCAIVWIPGMTTRVKVSTLQTISMCINRFIPPLTLLNIDSMKDHSLDRLGETLLIYLSDTEWEVRDSALELVIVCMKLAKEKYQYFVSWFLKHGLLDIVLQAVGDVEPYVQASAMSVLTSITCIDKIWEKLKERGVKQLALRAVVRAEDNSIRKVGLELIQALFLSKRFGNDEIENLVIPVIQQSTGDPDDEIRLTALKFIYQHIETDLTTMGMVDGEFPAVTFYSGKITKLEREEVNSRVLSVICGFCQIGNFQSVVNCSKDSVPEVASESYKIMMYIKTLICKYNLQNKFSENLDSQRFNTEASHKSDGENQETNMEISDRPPLTAENLDEGMNDVLNTSDLSTIIKLKVNSLEIPKLWWNGEISGIILSPDEIPSRMQTISSRNMFIELEKVTSEKLKFEDETYKDLERNVLLLIEDIFLETGSSNIENESREMDCY